MITIRKDVLSGATAQQIRGQAAGPGPGPAPPTWPSGSPSIPT